MAMRTHRFSHLVILRSVLVLPPHLVRESDWLSWVADTVVRGVVYHRTPAFLEERILREGLRVERSEYGDCQGVYFSASGPWSRITRDAVTLRAVVRLRHPLRVSEVADIPEQVGLRRLTADPVDVRRRLLAAGFDGVLTEVRNLGDQQPNQFIVVLRDEDIRLVVDDDFA